MLAAGGLRSCAPKMLGISMPPPAAPASALFLLAAPRAYLASLFKGGGSGSGIEAAAMLPCTPWGGWPPLLPCWGGGLAGGLCMCCCCCAACMSCCCCCSALGGRAGTSEPWGPVRRRERRVTGCQSIGVDERVLTGSGAAIPTTCTRDKHPLSLSFALSADKHT